MNPEDGGTTPKFWHPAKRPHGTKNKVWVDVKSGESPQPWILVSTV